MELTFRNYIFVKPKTERLRTSSHLKAATRYVTPPKTANNTRRMCKKCFTKEYPKFNSTEEFEVFLKEFDEKIAKSIIFIKQEKYKSDIHSIYACENCKTIWWLSDPDNHWRGYFMKAINAKNYIDDDERNGKILKYGCLLIFLILTIFIFLKLIS
ncbi:hypothetical protein [Flavobacterium sandaracinum]|uniref:Uncharacterized protein n=1 Tax=Flavobacterium sandaracinum TaxID=2541733 RepID=A0A4V2YZX6_9FLAO|nr:hypothetical protein [Flavobacterium sandaracinum]TDD98817.1 hypothetical protein E0F91_17635 [Flavobacterium sandaracinum]